jgi:hypothetical protein
MPTSKLAEAYEPIPVRHHYNHDDPDIQQPSNPHSFQSQMQQQPGSGFRGGAMPLTPAPSPPPSPKPKKQQYQTDPTRPFLFPFSRKRGRGGDMMLVPFAIEEADMLYHRHMYVSQSLWQMWRTREECMTADSGLERLPGVDEAADMLGRLNLNSGETRQPPKNADEDAEDDLNPDAVLLDAKIAEVEEALRREKGDTRQLRVRKEDLMRLRRVETIYVCRLQLLYQSY